jgi:hypothetical protein
MNKIFNLHTLYAGLFIATALLFASCSDDDSYDFPGDSNSRIYIANSVDAKVSTYAVTKTPVGAIGVVSLKIPVHCTQKMQSEVKVTVAMDTSLISAYNEKNSTSYLSVPDGSVTLEHATLTIPANSFVSADSVTVSISKSEIVKLTDKGKYLIPVVIKSTDGANSAVSTNMNSTYMLVTIATDADNIWDAATSIDITGSLVSDRSGWTVAMSATSTYTYGSSSNMFDGNASYPSYWSQRFTGSVDMIVDMGKTYSNITGLYIKTMISGSTISTSLDGAIWSEQGKVSGTGTSIVFYGSIDARYIKWTTNKTGSYYMYAYEFNAYIK